LSSLTRGCPTYHVVGGDILEHHPHGFPRQLGNFADGLGHAAGDLVLALLRMAREDADVDEWHGYLLASSQCQQLVA
jgi:hypothetical protein